MKKKGPSSYQEDKQVKGKGPCIKPMNNENKMCQVYIQPRSPLSQERTLKRAKLGSWEKDMQAEGTTQNWRSIKALHMDQGKMENPLPQGRIRRFPGLVYSEVES